MIVLDDFFEYGMSSQLALNTVDRMAVNTRDYAVWLPIYTHLYNGTLQKISAKTLTQKEHNIH